MDEKSFIQMFVNKHQNLLEVAFNIVLVNRKARKATLIESADYSYDDTIFPFIKNNYNKLLNSNITAKNRTLIPPQFLIYYKDVPRAEVDAALNTDIGMGKILGFLCAGQLGGAFSIAYYINETIFYIESCAERPTQDMVDQIIQRYDSFKQIGTELGYNVTYEIQERLLGNDILELLINSNINGLFNNKSSVFDFYNELGYVITADCFNPEITLDKLRDLFTKYDRLWIVIACNIIYDPAKMFYGKMTIDQGEEFRQNIYDLENKLYMFWK
jgi:hypothetical protein